MDEKGAGGEAKPTWPQFPGWLVRIAQLDPAAHRESRYSTVAAKLRADIESSEFWYLLVGSLQEVGDDYTLERGYKLFATPEKPQLQVKPYASVLNKAFRKNVVTNANWPEPPTGGWVTPANWYDQLNDIVRTSLVVKYLDGVEFLVRRIESMAASEGNRFTVDYEARDEGYYAAHCYIWFALEIPRLDWDTERVELRLEIQVTTQLQDVIRKLTHDYYERRRSLPATSDLKWQWDYSSPDFLPNYLGHILHYVEGMIMEVRTRRDPK